MADRLSAHGVRRGIKQLIQTSYLDDGIRKTERISFATCDGLKIHMTISLRSLGWMIDLEVDSELSADNSERRAEDARQLETYLGWPQSSNLGIGHTLLPFDSRLKDWGTRDVIDDVYTSLKRLLHTEACCCGRSRKHSTCQLCTMCLFEGTVQLEADCPICLQLLTNRSVVTDCCSQLAHETCLARLPNRCFNCREEPLNWTKTENVSIEE